MGLRTLGYALWVFGWVLLAGCAGERAFTATVHEDDTWIVRLLKVDPGKDRRYTHPAPLEAETLERLLAGVGVVQDGGRWRPLFTEYERRRLGVLLHRGLTTAGPDEVVTFVQVLPASSWQERVTSGGVFVTEGKLHFLLANFQVKRERWQDTDDYRPPIETRPLKPVAPLPAGLAYRPADRLLDPGRAGDAFRVPLGLSPWHIALDYRGS